MDKCPALQRICIRTNIVIYFMRLYIMFCETVKHEFNSHENTGILKNSRILYNLKYIEFSCNMLLIHI